MTNEQVCSDCGDDLERPYRANANYVKSEKFKDTEVQEVNYALVHTDETKKKFNKINRLFPDRQRDAINAEMAHPNAPETVEVPAGTKEVEEEDGAVTVTADRREMEFSIPVEKFDKVEVDDPHVVDREDDVAIVLREQEPRKVQKTGLVCRDCTEDSDEIIWGIDSE